MRHITQAEIKTYGNELVDRWQERRQLEQDEEAQKLKHKAKISDIQNKMETIDLRIDTLSRWLKTGQKEPEQESLPLDGNDSNDGSQTKTTSKATSVEVHVHHHSDGTIPAARQLNAAPVDAPPADAIDAELIETELPTDPKDLAIHQALHQLTGAENRWTVLRNAYPAGVPDRALESAIKHEFNGKGSLSGGGLLAAWTNSPTLKFWFGKVEAKGKPTLEGARLVAACRAVLGLEPPTAKPSSKRGRK